MVSFGWWDNCLSKLIVIWPVYGFFAHFLVEWFVILGMIIWSFHLLISLLANWLSKLTAWLFTWWLVGFISVAYITHINHLVFKHLPSLATKTHDHVWLLVVTARSSTEINIFFKFWFDFTFHVKMVFNVKNLEKKITFSCHFRSFYKMWELCFVKLCFLLRWTLTKWE